MKIVIIIFAMITFTKANCFDLINADTVNVDEFLKKRFGYMGLYPDTIGLSEDLAYFRNGIKGCFEELEDYEKRCNMDILTYFTNDTAYVVDFIKRLKVIKKKYMSITNSIVLGQMKESVCAFVSIFISYDYFQKLLNEYEVPEITAEEFIKRSRGEIKSEKVDLYISFYRYSYGRNESPDYDTFMQKVNKDPLLKLLAPYLKKNSTSPLKDLSNDSLLAFFKEIMKLDKKYKLMITKGTGIFTIINKIEYRIYDRWRFVQNALKEGIDSTNIAIYNKNINFLRAPEVKEMLKLVGEKLSEEEKKRTIYPKVVSFVDSLQTVGNKK